jgi:hypothetical protein
VPNSTDQDLLPGDATQPYLPTFSTGEFPAPPDPVQPLAAERDPVEAQTGPLRPLAQPEAVPGTFHYLKRWTLLLVVAGVWTVGAGCGLGLYYWWFHSLDKTPPVFTVLLFMIVCTVGALMTAMVGDKPLVSALGIALMSAPLAALGGAAVLHGLYFCEWASRCFVGLIPY